MDLNKDQMLSFEELKLGLHKFGHQMPDADVQTLMTFMTERAARTEYSEEPLLK